MPTRSAIPSRTALSITFLMPAFLMPAMLSVPQAATRSLVQVRSTSPWTLHELEAQHLDLVSYDPDTGAVYLTVTAAQQRLLLDQGYVLTTVEPDAEAGLKRLQAEPDLGLYHTVAELEAELRELEALYPESCRLEILGRSLEQRPIYALKISDSPELEDADEPDVLIVGNHHARELMTVEVPLHFARYLLEQQVRDRRVRSLVEGREIWIVPLLNPDGHVYQEETQGRPGWRKNRRPNPDDTYGVDLNRNYSFRWGHDEEGSSAEPLSETYRGTEAFSEPETAVLRDLVERHEFVIAISYHSFGALLLYPWGWTRDELTPDHQLFVSLANDMVRDNGYRPGNPASNTIYLTNGDFDDYMYGELNARKRRRTLAFTVELNTANQGGFWPGDELIEPTCELLLPLNLFAAEVATSDLVARLPPPQPVLELVQDDRYPWVLDLSWSVAAEPEDPVDHYQIFEIDPMGLDTMVRAVGRASTASLATSDRQLLCEQLPVPTDGALVLEMSAQLENLWDYAYVEVREPGGSWQALPAEIVKRGNPTGRNRGNGITGSFAARTVRFNASAQAGALVDVGVRLDAYPGGPTPAWVKARLDPVATYRERRRTLVDDLHATSYQLQAERPGLFGYGVTAVSRAGLMTDSEVEWVWIPEVQAVEMADLGLAVVGGRITLSWQMHSDSPARFEAWSRTLQRGEVPGDEAGEWALGSYRQQSVARVSHSGPASLSWAAEPGRYAVLLLGEDADGPRLWGPWVADIAGATALHAAVPNPFNPRTRVRFDLARDAQALLEVIAPDGRRVRTLASGYFRAGSYVFEWDGRDSNGRSLASGIYLARFNALGQRQTQRLVLIR